MTITTTNITIRPVEAADLGLLWERTFKEEAPEWKKWDAPYFPHQAMRYEDFLPKGESWIGCDDLWVIESDGELCGVITYYWEHKGSRWLEMGIVLHESKAWGKGIGTAALTQWINRLFATMPLVRVGLTTWSGNARMIRVAEKLGMQMEARIRKVRYHNGHYYDSIRMGILREEWDERNA